MARNEVSPERQARVSKLLARLAAPGMPVITRADALALGVSSEERLAELEAAAERAERSRTPKVAPEPETPAPPAPSTVDVLDPRPRVEAPPAETDPKPKRAKKRKGKVKTA